MVPSLGDRDGSLVLVRDWHARSQRTIRAVWLRLLRRPAKLYMGASIQYPSTGAEKLGEWDKPELMSYPDDVLFSLSSKHTHPASAVQTA